MLAKVESSSTLDYMKGNNSKSVKVYADTFKEISKIKKECKLPKQAIVRIAMAALIEDLNSGKRISAYGLR